MNRFWTACLLIVASIGLFGGVNAATSANGPDTGCWDEYNKRGTRLFRVVAPAGLDPADCTAGVGCFSSYRASDGKLVRQLVPHGQAVTDACETTTTTTTVPPTTTTTVPPTTTTTVPPTTTTTVPPTSSGFSETFDANTGLARFDTGIYHRDNHLVANTTWTGDHDLNCGSPDTQRTINRDNKSGSFYTCKDHMMTSIGDTSGYSTGWFSPKQTFTEETRVTWDVNVTDLKNRQWWEVSIVPADYYSGVADCPQCSVIDWLSPDPSGLPSYPANSVVVGNGPFGNTFSAHSNNVSFNPSGWQRVCGDFALDPEGCASKTIRRTFTLIDNGNNTVTLEAFGDEYTFAGSFPDDFNVVFKDHNYTPDKDGVPAGYTWHWDNISVS